LWSWWGHYFLELLYLIKKKHEKSFLLIILQKWCVSPHLFVFINFFNYRASWSDKSWMFFFLLHSNSSARSWLLLSWCFRSSRPSRSIRIRFLHLLFWPLQFGFDFQACYFAADACPWLYFVFLKHELYSF
jgi:hypothetical protein